MYYLSAHTICACECFDILPCRRFVLNDMYTVCYCVHAHVHMRMYTKRYINNWRPFAQNPRSASSPFHSSRSQKGLMTFLHETLTKPTGAPTLIVRDFVRFILCAYSTAAADVDACCCCGVSTLCSFLLMFSFSQRCAWRMDGC